MNQKFLFVLALGFVVLISGCTLPSQTQLPVCGNKVCESSENITSCPADCGQSSDGGDQISGDGTTDNGIIIDDSESRPPAPVCGNDICENTETAENCSEDCGQPSDNGQTNPDTTDADENNAIEGPSCGNNICEQGETIANCQSDCKSTPLNNVCGDGACTGTETYETCADDCNVPATEVPGQTYTPPSDIGKVTNTMTLYVGGQGYEDGQVGKDSKNAASQQIIAGATDKEYRAYFDFDTTRIPDGAEIKSVVLNVYVNAVENVPKHSIHKLSSKAFGRETKDIWADIGNCSSGDCYIENENLFGSGGWKKISLGFDASSDLQNLLNQNYFSVGVRGPPGDPTGDPVNKDAKLASNNSSVNIPYLTVIYESDEWPPLQSANLLKNAGFETGLAYPWVKFDESSKAKTAGVVDSGGTERKYSYRIMNDVFSGETYILTQMITVTPKTDYVFGGALKSSLNKGSCQLDFYNRSGGGLDTEGISVSGNAGWKYFSERFTTPLGATDVEIRLIMTGSADGECLFDDIYIGKVS